MRPFALSGPIVNPHLSLLQAYPFEKLRQLFAGITPPADKSIIRLSIGEPRHATPESIKTALTEHLASLAHYPTTQGDAKLRAAISQWLARRYHIAPPDPERAILPVNGSREALFAFAQTIVDPTRPGGALVACPNPFYQIYEGAALLAGAQPVFIDHRAERDFALDWAALDEATWARVQLLYVCSPDNPTGHVLSLDDWRQLFTLADRYGFVIASDECYSEIYPDEAAPPLGSLQAAHLLGRGDERLVMFSSLSKRSNAPGLRSGFVAGDATLIEAFLRYRTYHGCAMNPAVQAASIAAWNDEEHVIANRRLYREKFACITPLIAEHLTVSPPGAGFYLWANVRRTGLSDTEFARRLYARQNVVVLPGSFLARENDGRNPGADFVRIALVASLDECLEAAGRIADFCSAL